ncbi:MAG: hypothetical protein IJ498_09255 [Akkermansia sp.]|nr:hypothetical protein [Akkermansia sp.]
MNIKLNRHHFLILHHLYLIPLGDMLSSGAWGNRIFLTYWVWGVLLYVCSFIREKKRRWCFYGLVHGFAGLMLYFLLFI